MRPTVPALMAALFCTLVATAPADAEPATSLDRCISAIAGDVLRFVDKAGKCIRKCEDARRRGELAPNVRCRRPSNHPKTQSCLLTAVEQLTGSRSNALKRCTNDEVELFYGGSNTCPGNNDSVNGILECLARRSERAVESLTKKIYRPKQPVPPPVCGDGEITGFEECDPARFPNGCADPFGSLCHPQYCYCTFFGCGNGILEPGEDCDYNASPNGCSFDRFCSSSCSCRASGSASKAFLSESRDLID